MAGDSMSGTCDYGFGITNDNWTVRYDTTYHPPYCICLGAIASIVRYEWGPKIHECGWLSSTKLLTDPCQYFLRSERFFERLPRGPLRAESNGKRVYFQEDMFDPLVEFTPHRRPIDRISAQSCGEGFFHLLEDGQLPSKMLTEAPRNNDYTLEETGPVVAVFGLVLERSWDGPQPLLYMPVHSSCLDLLDRFLTSYDGYSGYIESTSQVFDIFRARIGPHLYKEDQLNVMKLVLEDEIRSLKPQSTDTLRWLDIWDLGSDEKSEPDLDVEAQAEIKLAWDPIHRLNLEELTHLRERQKTILDEERINAIICEQLQSDPMAEQDYTLALQACAPRLSVEMLQTTKFQQRLDDLPQELVDQIMEYVCSPSMFSMECNRLLPPSTWLNWLKSGNLIPYLWDFAVDPNLEKGQIDWEKFFRMVVQDEPITVDHPLNDMPPGFKNRRRIWRSLQTLRPDELHYISAHEYRQMESEPDYYGDAFPSLFFDEAEHEAERLVQKNEAYTSIGLEWAPDVDERLSFGGRWTVKWRQIGPSENT